MVEALEKEGGGWECGSIKQHGRKSKCNRPAVVRKVFATGQGERRTGRSDCPLCTAREIVKSSTEDHGYPVREWDFE